MTFLVSDELKLSLDPFTNMIVALLERTVPLRLVEMFCTKTV
ncbi:hypothetical protein [Methanobrevibacter arboriphilus]|nr:hypothetical protein [Methanobrevibacter arboriphilus]